MLGILNGVIEHLIAIVCVRTCVQQPVGIEARRSTPGAACKFQGWCCRWCASCRWCFGWIGCSGERLRWRQRDCWRACHPDEAALESADVAQRLAACKQFAANAMAATAAPRTDGCCCH